MLRTNLIGKARIMLVAALSVLVAATAASAQSAPCGPRAEVVAWLEGAYNELPVAYGLVGDRRILEIHVSDTGSWTALLTGVNGISCMVSAGHSWTPLVPPIGGAATQDAAELD